MAQALLKDFLSPSFVRTISALIAEVIPSFNPEKFYKDVFTTEWQQYELKQRNNHLAVCLREQLVEDFPQAIKQLVHISNHIKNHKLPNTNDFVYIFIPTVIELFGGNYFYESMDAMQEVTQLISCEFAIRQFYYSHEKQTLQKALEWTSHTSEHVRRLASEGCRPALPWGQALNNFKEEPEKILPILDCLKADDSLFVRKSVANNLNDISKTHPELITQVVKQWKGTHQHTNWILKHGCRTLLKKGYAPILPEFGYLVPKGITVLNFNPTKKITENEKLIIKFDVLNSTDKVKKLRLEYAIYFIRSNGSHSKKVFMISETNIKSAQQLGFSKSFSFKPLTTRRYYKGEHFISIIVNGLEQEKLLFEFV